MPAFLNQLGAYDGAPQTKLAVQLRVLTFVRSGQLRGALWNEFELDKSQWRIPAERMKMRSEHMVPLSIQAIHVVTELHKLNDR